MSDIHHREGQVSVPWTLKTPPIQHRLMHLAITVMHHPPRLVVGGGFEGGLTPAHLCSSDLMKGIAPVEGN